jgi:peptide/nickel transport system substrate-binding protein
MSQMRRIFLFLIIISSLIFVFACRTAPGDAVTIVTSDKFSGLDTLSTTSPDAAADRVRNLIYNSLVRKNERFEYVGDLARDIQIGADNLSLTFVLQENVKFHNGKVLTAADAKYTLDALFQANGYKAGSFFDNVNGQKEAHIASIETPDEKTLVIRVRRTALVNQLLANLVTIPIIPEGTIEQQQTAPVGTGPFKFLRFDQVNSFVELETNPEYFEGAPKIQKLNIKTVTDANALQAELQTGRVDLVPNPRNFSADTLNLLKQNQNLQVIQSNGSNVRYIGFNVAAKPLDNLKLRQAIAHAVNRDKIVSDLLAGQAQVANSILPENSWAYHPGAIYNYDPARARQLVQESGYNGELIQFKISAGSSAVSQYAQVIQDGLREVGINSEIVPLELNTLLEQFRQGQFQMTTSEWIGGNQDPIFLRDLFASTEFPEKKSGGRNRSRYSNPEFDRIVQEAVDTVDKNRAGELYRQAQEIVSRDLPLFPLWYPSNIVVATQRLGNININASGDWSFVKDITVSQ